MFVWTTCSRTAKEQDLMADMACTPILAQYAEDTVRDDTKMYNIVMDFKDKLAKIFLEKGLMAESYRLADFKAVAVETAREQTCSFQNLSNNVMRVLKLIAEVISALVNKIKAPQVDTCKTPPQTDVLVNPSKLSSASIKKEQYVFNDNVDDGDTDKNSLNSTPLTTTTTPPPTLSATSSQPPTPTYDPVLRRSSRTSVLNRKPLGNPVIMRGSNGNLQTSFASQGPQHTFQCSECSKTFQNSRTLRSHQKTHSSSSVSDLGRKSTNRRMKNGGVTQLNDFPITSSRLRANCVNQPSKGDDSRALDPLSNWHAGISGHGKGARQFDAETWQAEDAVTSGRVVCEKQTVKEDTDVLDTGGTMTAWNLMLGKGLAKNGAKTLAVATDGSCQLGKVTPKADASISEVSDVANGGSLEFRKELPEDGAKTSDTEDSGTARNVILGREMPKGIAKMSDHTAHLDIVTANIWECGKGVLKEENLHCLESTDAMATEEEGSLKMEDEKDLGDKVDESSLQAECEGQRLSTSHPSPSRKNHQLMLNNGIDSNDGNNSADAEQKCQGSSEVESQESSEVKGQGSSEIEGQGSSAAQPSETLNCGLMGSFYELTAVGFYRCSVCGTETKDRSNMRKHVLRWHAKEQIHHCPVCGKAFAYQESLKFHMKVHTDPNSRAFERTDQGSYRCKQCGRECKNRSNMVKHVNRKHLKAGEKPYKCSQCSSAFGCLRSLTRHELVHRGERPYPCLQCDRRFFDPTSLRTHTRVHSDDRPFSCPVCGSRFRQKEGLKGHMRSHTGDKPYVCDRCGMAFAAKRSLTRHIRVHTGERPYTCDQCVAAFADWTTLHNHKLVHRHSDTATNTTEHHPGHSDTTSENKPYQCQFCGFQYSDPLTLKRHLRVHTTLSKSVRPACMKKLPGGGGRCSNPGGEATSEVSQALHRQYRPYVCEVCGQRFKHLRGYTTHKGKHSNSNSEGNASFLFGNKAPTCLSVTRSDPQMGGGFEGGCITYEPAAVQVFSGSDLLSQGSEVTVSVFEPALPPPSQPLQPESQPDVNIVQGMLSNYSSLSEMSTTSEGDPLGEVSSISGSDSITSEVQPSIIIGSHRHHHHHHDSSLVGRYAALPGGLAQVIHYEDGSLGHVTSTATAASCDTTELLPHPPLSSSSSLVLQPMEDLLDNVVTMVFESADDSIVLDSR